MSCCCENYKDLGCFLHCNQIDTGLKAGVGTFRVLLEFNGRTIVHEVVLAADESIKILPEWVNENYSHTFQVLKSDDSIFKDGEFDCFTFKTI